MYVACISLFLPPPPPPLLKLVKDGIKWCVCLHPVRLFACEIRELLADCPDGLGINAVNPNYKIKFQRDFAVQNYGFSKLIAALEAIQDVIVVSVCERLLTLNHMSVCSKWQPSAGLLYGSLMQCASV